MWLASARTARLPAASPSLPPLLARVAANVTVARVATLTRGDALVVRAAWTDLLARTQAWQICSLYLHLESGSVTVTRSRPRCVPDQPLRCTRTPLLVITYSQQPSPLLHPAGLPEGS